MERDLRDRHEDGYLDPVEEWTGATPVVPPSTEPLPRPVAETSAHLTGPMQPPQIRHGQPSISGVARNIEVRTDSDQVEVLVVRLDQYGLDGRRSLSAGVELYGNTHGQIGEVRSLVLGTVLVPVLAFIAFCATSVLTHA